MSSEEAAERLWLTTTPHFEGYRIVRYLGVVTGSFQGTPSEKDALRREQGDSSFGAIMGLPRVDKCRRQAVKSMRENALRLGANAIVGLRFDSLLVPALMGTFEVVAYGTAVVIELVEQHPE